MVICSYIYFILAFFFSFSFLIFVDDKISSTYALAAALNARCSIRIEAIARCGAVHVEKKTGPAYKTPNERDTTVPNKLLSVNIGERSVTITGLDYILPTRVPRGFIGTVRCRGAGYRSAPPINAPRQVGQ